LSAAANVVVCEEHDLDPEHASRLRGRTVQELRADAVQLRKADRVMLSPVLSRAAKNHE